VHRASCAATTDAAILRAVVEVARRAQEDRRAVTRIRPGKAERDIELMRQREAEAEARRRAAAEEERRRREQAEREQRQRGVKGDG
jgi:hypothetical protein